MSNMHYDEFIHVCYGQLRIFIVETTQSMHFHFPQTFLTKHVSIYLGSLSHIFRKDITSEEGVEVDDKKKRLTPSKGTQFRNYHGQQYATRRKDEKSGPSMIMKKEQVRHAALIGSFLLISLREHFVQMQFGLWQELRLQFGVIQQFCNDQFSN